MVCFLKSLCECVFWYNGMGVSVYVLGMFISVFVLVMLYVS